MDGRPTRVQFHEQVTEHAARLGVSEHFVAVRRRALMLKLMGAEVRPGQSGGIPYKIASSSVEELEKILQVIEVWTPNRSKVTLYAARSPEVHPETAYGQRIQELRQYGFAFGGEGKSRSGIAPTYGYTGDRHWGWMLDYQAAEAVADAFYMMNDAAFQQRRGRRTVIRWSAIAEALNEQGYVRKDGGDWTGDDVRSLLRSPTYCGYYYNKNVGVRRAEFIKEPIVEPKLFIKLAGLYSGNKYIRVWYDDLARLIEELR